ncbi:light-sensor Protein kinase-like [Silene latifolia]|uniref:light-sensor Protein kinase-like n=1 Tax=Silene latifolia TaxID=37657 RepID=UPI003D787BDC
MMSRDLGSHIKEFYNPRKRIPLSVPVAVDIMLQIARGRKYLHSKKIFHGDLNPSNIIVKPRGSSSEGFVHVKVSKFGPSSVTTPKHKKINSSEALSYIWYAPEVLAGQEESRHDADTKYKENSDVYSFGMVCFELLSEKVPFDDAHLQGEKMTRNIRAGERPLFPLHCPKFMINFTKKCWHSDPHQRPTFSSISRILGYIQRFLVMNLDHNYPDALVPPVDYCDIESTFLKNFPSWMINEAQPVSEIPLQMFAYRVMERERCMSHFRDINESSSDGNSMSGDEHVANADDPFIPVSETKITVRHESINERLSIARRSPDTKANRNPANYLPP